MKYSTATRLISDSDLFLGCMLIVNATKKHFHQWNQTLGPQCTSNRALYYKTDCVSRFMIPVESHLRSYLATSAVQDSNTCF